MYKPTSYISLTKNEITISKYPAEFSNNPLPNFSLVKKMPSRQNVVKSLEPERMKEIHYTHFCWHDTTLADSWLFSVCGSETHWSGKIVPWDKIQIDKEALFLRKRIALWCLWQWRIFHGSYKHVWYWIKEW